MVKLQLQYVHVINNLSSSLWSNSILCEISVPGRKNHMYAVLHIKVTERNGKIKRKLIIHK